MTWLVRLPEGASAALFWSQLVLLWTVVGYGPISDPSGRQEGRTGPAWRRWTMLLRGAVAATGAAILAFTAGSPWGRCLSLAVGVGAGAFVLPAVRHRLAHSKANYTYLAEWELAGNVLFLCATFVLVGEWDLRMQRPFLRLPIPDGQLAVIILCAATALFSVRGGTHIVRSVLDKTNALPTQKKAVSSSSGDPASAGEDSSRVDVPEYNRGRLIGNIERLVLVYVVVVGSYEAIGFLVAAKGLIRAKEFEDRDFAEYFIVGSLVSVAVALVLGAALRAAIAALW